MEDFSTWFALFIVYFAPTIVAIWHGKGTWNDVGHVMLLNLLIGWTGIGYLIATLVALIDFKQRRINNNRNLLVKQARDQFYLREAEKAALE